MIRKSLSSLFYISIVLFLFLFIFAVLGRQLFAGKLVPPPAGASLYTYTLTLTRTHSLTHTDSYETHLCLVYPDLGFLRTHAHSLL